MCVEVQHEIRLSCSCGNDRCFADFFYTIPVIHRQRVTVKVTHLLPNAIARLKKHKSTSGVVIQYLFNLSLVGNPIELSIEWMRCFYGSG